jgi:putative transposase
LNSYFQAWIDVEYHRREHHSIGVAPFTRFTEAMKTTPVRKIESLEEITEIFLYRDVRKVHKSNAVIKVGGNRYQATDPSLLGVEIEARFDPYDLSRIFIYRNGVFVQTAYPLDLKNQAYTAFSEEADTPVLTIRKSSTEFFAMMKQREEELHHKENNHFDFTRFNKTKEN